LLLITALPWDFHHISVIAWTKTPPTGGVFIAKRVGVGRSPPSAASLMIAIKPYGYLQDVNTDVGRWIEYTQLLIRFNGIIGINNWADKGVAHGIILQGALEMLSLLLSSLFVLSRFVIFAEIQVFLHRRI